MIQIHDPGYPTLADSALFAPNDFWRLRWVAAELPVELTGVEARIVMLLGGALPTGSVDVLSAYGIVRAAEEEGTIAPGRTNLLSPCTATLGPGAAWVARRRGYRHTVACPKSLDEEGRAAHRVYGTELIDLSAAGDRELLTRVAELAADPDVALIAPYESMAAYRFHHQVTGGAILDTIDGAIAALVSSASTPATFAAADRVKPVYPEALTIAVESGQGGALWRAAQGEEAEGVLMPLNVDLDGLDRVARVDPALGAVVRDYCVRELGYRWEMGPGSIANLMAAIQVARAEGFDSDAVVVVIGCDGGDGRPVDSSGRTFAGIGGLRELGDEGLADLTPPAVRNRLWAVRDVFWRDLVPKEELARRHARDFWRAAGQPEDAPSEESG